jgi:hypothetical protein
VKYVAALLCLLVFVDSFGYAAAVLDHYPRAAWGR